MVHHDKSPMMKLQQSGSCPYYFSNTITANLKAKGETWQLRGKTPPLGPWGVLPLYREIPTTHPFWVGAPWADRVVSPIDQGSLGVAIVGNTHHASSQGFPRHPLLPDTLPGG